MHYYDLINKHYKMPKITILIIFATIFVFFYILNIEITDVYNTYSYVEEDKIVISIPINYPDTLNKMEYMKVNDEVCNLKMLSISEVMLDEQNMINYQEVRFQKEGLINNQVIKVSIHYNKEKVYQKLKRIIF